MKFFYLIIAILLSSFSFSQDDEKIKTEGEITEITVHQGKRVRETAIVKFNLEDGTEQIGSVELFRIPFIGSMKSVGDKINIVYAKNNPFLLESTAGNFLSTYGMYILIFLGIIMSARTILKSRKKTVSQ